MIRLSDVMREMVKDVAMHLKNVTKGNHAFSRLDIKKGMSTFSPIVNNS